MFHSLIRILILLLIFMACSKESRKDFLVLDYQWKKEEVSHVRRSLASEEVPECRSDFFRKDLIQKENKILEEKLQKDQKVRGSWKHIDLSTLPTAQANFLVKFGKDLGDQNKNDYDFSSCSDVPCILNAIYESSDGLEGQVIYFWYLKMGSMLGVDNKIDEQVSTEPGIYFGKTHAFKNYLFSRDELYGFWRLAQTLPLKYQSLTNLDVIERIPKGAFFENEEEGVCGLAGNWGVIRVNDQCLSIGDSKRRGEGYFYQAVPHELSHEVDFFTAEFIKPHTSYYSHTEEWKNEGRWIIKEILDTSTGAIKLRQWDYSLEDEKFVSDYARTSPQEHFAETLSMMYASGEYSKKTIPSSTHELVQQKFFDSQLFDTKNKTAAFYPIIDRFDVNIFKATEECLKAPGSVLKNQKVEDYLKDVSSPAVKSCLGVKIKDFSEEITRVINREQFYGCDYSKDVQVAPKFFNELYTVIGNKINHHYQQYLQDKEYFKLFAEFYKQFETIREGQIAYMSCQGESDEVICYENAIKKQIIELMPPEFEFKETAVADLQAAYLKKFPFSVVKDQTILSYQQFVTSSQLAISEKAQSLWQLCVQKPANDEAAPVGTPFSSRTQYVVSSLMICINQNISSELEQLVSTMNSDILIKSEKEKKLLKSLTLPFFINTLDQELKLAVENELKQIKDYQEKKKISLSQELTADFSWAKSLRNQAQLKMECQGKVNSSINMELHFHLLKDVFYQFNDELCQNIITGPEMKTYMEKVYQSSWGAAEDYLRDSLTNKAKVKAQDCLNFYPKSAGLLASMNAKKRLSCFDDQWGYLEMLAMKDFKEAGPGAKYSFEAVELNQRFKKIAITIKEDIKKLYLQ